MARKGEKLSEETRRKISEAKKGIPNTPEHTAAIRKWYAENGVSDEKRKKISESRIALFAARRSHKWRNPKRP